jgi:hypothetical protein
VNLLFGPPGGVELPIRDSAEAPSFGSERFSGGAKAGNGDKTVNSA